MTSDAEVAATIATQIAGPGFALSLAGGTMRQLSEHGENHSHPSPVARLEAGDWRETRYRKHISKMGEDSGQSSTYGSGCTLSR